jgi:hypothetical protein
LVVAAEPQEPLVLVQVEQVVLVIYLLVVQAQQVQA